MPTPPSDQGCVGDPREHLERVILLLGEVLAHRGCRRNRRTRGCRRARRRSRGPRNSRTSARRPPTWRRPCGRARTRGSPDARGGSGSGSQSLAERRVPSAIGIQRVRDRADVVDFARGVCSSLDLRHRATNIARWRQRGSRWRGGESSWRARCGPRRARAHDPGARPRSAAAHADRGEPASAFAAARPRASPTSTRARRSACSPRSRPTA